jgi:predicted dehydrogenase
MAAHVEKLNWLVVGIGDITTRRVIPAIQAEPRSNLYGVVSRDRAKGAQYSDRVWTDLADSLLDRSVDAVYVATPVFLHAPQSIAALQAACIPSCSVRENCWCKE